jgi:hypothetical protein
LHGDAVRGFGAGSAATVDGSCRLTAKTVASPAVFALERLPSRSSGIPSRRLLPGGCRTTAFVLSQRGKSPAVFEIDFKLNPRFALLVPTRAVRGRICRPQDPCKPAPSMQAHCSRRGGHRAPVQRFLRGAAPRWLRYTSATQLCAPATDLRQASAFLARPHLDRHVHSPYRAVSALPPAASGAWAADMTVEQVETIAWPHKAHPRNSPAKISL